MRGVAAALLLAAVLETGTVQPKYVEAAAAAGLNFRFRTSATPTKYLIETMGGGVAIFDYDNDGRPDVFFVNGAALKKSQSDAEAPDKSAPEFWNRLFHNNGDGTFTDVTEKSGLRGSGYGRGVATGDYDNDGFTDLLVTSYGGATLYRNNGNGTFTDVTAAAGLKTSGWTAGAAFLDYDNDGRLDLVICRYMDWNFTSGAMVCGSDVPGGRAYCHPDEFPAASNYLFHNNGNGTFSDVSTASGFGAVKGKALGVAIGDYNNDGFIDIYVANDAVPQMLFRNNGNGTFTEVATRAGVAYTEDGKAFSGMGTVFADLDDDGFPDILTTALPYEYYALFQNTGKGQFRYASVSTGLAKLTRPYGGWGIHVFDYDNDGDKEVFIANSHVMDNIEVTQPHLRTMEPPLLLKYSGKQFVNISEGAGDVFAQAWMSRGAAFGDLDNDGDIDIVISDYSGPAHFLRNEGGNRNHWIGLDLRGTKSNRDAIGAKVVLTTGAGRTHYAMVSTAGSYLSANDRRVFFGLGQEQAIREVRVRWPSGIEQALANPPIDRILKVTEGTASAAEQMQRGFVLAREGKNTAAIEAFSEAVRLDPNLVEAHFSLGVLLARQGRDRYGEAMHHFLEVLRLNPADVDARVNISNLLEEEGDLKGSVAEMGKAVGSAPKNPELHLLLGRKQHKARLYAEAADSFRKALELGGSPARAHYGLGLALKYLGRPDEAAREFEVVLQSDAHDASAHFELATVLAVQDRVPEAVAHMEKTVQLKPEMADAWAELGKLYRRQNRDSDAEKAFRTAVKLKPDSMTALYPLARLSDDPELFARIRELKTRDAEAGRAGDLNTEGVTLMGQGKLDEALAAFRQAFKNDPEFAVAAYNIGVVQARRGNTREATDAFRNAIRLRPSFAEAHLGLGLMLKLAGDRGAEEEFRTAQMLTRLGTGK